METKTVLASSSKSSDIITPSVQTLLHQFQESINTVFQKFDCDQFSPLLDKIIHSNGNLFFTGVGKSGIIAQKTASTLSSSGTKAWYISAQDALHGDMGVIEENDLVFLLSKSGETTELLSLCQPLKNKGAFLIAVVMNKASRLAKASDMVIVLPETKELCPFDLAPTTSTLAQLIFGDLLAISLMRQKNISLHDFIQNHPSGRIGRRHLVKVKDIMIRGKSLPKCSPYDHLGDVLVELSNKQCGCVCVLGENDILLGIFTDGDLRRALQKLGPQALGLPIHELMTRTPRSISPEALAVDAMRLMEQGSPITSLLVLDHDRCLGLVKMHDILQLGL